MHRLHRRVSYLWNEPEAAAAYTTAVSLHGHTNHSKECLSFLSEIFKDVGVLRWALECEQRRAERVGGIRVNFLGSYWVPPVSALGAFRLESKQITEKLGLSSIVSLTDHENIEAPMLLQMMGAPAEIPVSLEWTVPFGSTELHLGVHNLPAKDANSMVKELNRYTASHHPARLHDLLAALDEIPEVLIVLNHPMWDLCRVGRARHRKAVLKFMSDFGGYVHAMELGGLRSWEENQRVADLAAEWEQPVISGGDRHGYEPNACVNLTRAASFAEFVQEVRAGQSHVLFMPHYVEPLQIRFIRVVNDAVRTYPGSSIGVSWDDRVYHPDAEGVERPLSELWDGPPSYLQAVLSVFRWLDSAPMKRLVHTFGRQEQSLQLTGEASL